MTAPSPDPDVRDNEQRHVHHWCARPEDHPPHPFANAPSLHCTGFGRLSRLGSCEVAGCRDCAGCARTRYAAEAIYRRDPGLGTT